MSGEPTRSGTVGHSGVPSEHRHGGNCAGANSVNDPHQFPAQKHFDHPKYLDAETSLRTLARQAPTLPADLGQWHGPPPVACHAEDGSVRLAPWLLSEQELYRLLRLGDSGVRFPRATIARYRKLGLRSVKVSRRRWYTLADVLDFLDRQQIS